MEVHPPSPRERLRFGIFEADCFAGELSKRGLPVHLQDKPFQILLLLLERPGEIVTREELQKRLWPDGTFVDFEEGLNTAIKKLRYALGDSAESPVFIETIPRRGYRFIAPVTRDGSAEFARASAIPTPSINDEAHPGEQTCQSSSLSNDSLAPGIVQEKRFSKRRFSLQHVTAILAIALILVLASLGVVRWRARSAAKNVPGEVRSLAVLPLENVSGDPAQDYFADSMTDALITDLGEMGELRVISRTSAMQYRGVHKPLPQIARELNVDAVVEGTILRSGSRVRITAQLIEARADKHLWAKSYESNLGNVLELQSDVARAIASQILVKLTQRQHAALKSERFASAEAQDAYLRGHYFAEKGTIEDSQRAVTCFRKAIEMEPGSAATYAGLAGAYIALGHTLSQNPQEAFPLAEAAALKAIALDDMSEEAHAALGHVKFSYDWDFLGGEREFQLAIQLNPSSVRALGDYAKFLSAVGRPEEAIERAQQALRVDPLSLDAVTNVAWQLYQSRRYDEAIAQVRKVVEVDPRNISAHVCLGLSYEQKHEFSAAVAELEKATGFCRDKCYGLIGQVLALSGDRAGALQAIQQLKRRPYVSPFLVAIIYSEMGDKDQAFAWLEKAHEAHEPDLIVLYESPIFDNLRSDLRFKSLARRIGLPQAN